MYLVLAGVLQHKFLVINGVENTVELIIKLQRPDKVVQSQIIFLPLNQRPHERDEGVEQPLVKALEYHPGLQHLAQIAKLFHLLGINFGHKAPALGEDLQRPVGNQQADGLPHGDAAAAKASGDA